MLEFRNENEINLDDWSKFVFNSKYGNIFNTPEFFKVHKISGETKPNAIFLLDNSEIKGLLIYYKHVENSFILRKFASRNIILGGPIFNDDEKVLFELLNKYLENRHNVVFSQIRNIYNTEKYSEIFSNFGFKKSEHLDVHFNLKEGEENLWKNLHPSRRHNIRASYRKGVYVRLIEKDEKKLIERSYEILSNLYKKIKLPLYSKNFFINLVNILLPINYLKIFGAFLNDNMIGVRFILCYKNFLYYWYAGSDEKFLEYRPNDILPWEVIKWGANNGYEIFDFGGAGKPDSKYGVRDYKIRFGGTLVNLGRYEFTHKNLLMKAMKMGLNIRKIFKL